VKKILQNLFEIIRYRELPSDCKDILFYSEGSSHWPHLEGMITELLEIRKVPVCYFSSSKDDPAFKVDHPNFFVFKTDMGFIRNWFFENLDAKVVVMTMPDIDNFQIKRSRLGGHYVYVQHSLASLHMIYREGAFDHYDTVFCCGEYHKQEIRAMEKQYGTKVKNLVDHGYGLLDTIISDERALNVQRKKCKNTNILIAPSWGEHCLIESIGEELIATLLNQNFVVTLRPHPQTIKFSKSKIDSIDKRFSKNNNFQFDSQISSQDSMHDSDLMISDWSGVAYEYAFGRRKPVIFIDIPRKVNNPDYEILDIEPFEVSMRSEIGVILPRENISTIGEVIKTSISSPPDHTQVKGLIFNLGKSSSIAADYIIDQLRSA
jgi:hypothetical protein